MQFMLLKFVKTICQNSLKKPKTKVSFKRNQFHSSKTLKDRKFVSILL